MIVSPRFGGMLLDEAANSPSHRTHWHDGQLNRNMLAQNIDAVLSTLGMKTASPGIPNF